MSFQHRFLSVLAPFWRPKIAPKSIKNQSKLSFRALLFRHRFLYQCLIDFSSQLRPAGSQKTLFFLRKNEVFSKHGLSKITSISASILVPKSFPKSTKIPSKIDFQSHRIFNRFSHQFLHRFGSNLGPSWAPSWSHLGSENRPRAAQDAFQDAFGSQNPPRPPK